MPPTPLYTAITVLRTAVFAALDALTASGVYWLQAAQGATLPFCIFQSQDLGGAATKAVGKLDWSGLVTVRALAANQAAAEALMVAVAPGMASLTASGYTITTTYERPVIVPPSDNIWQAGHMWRVFIST